MSHDLTCPHCHKVFSVDESEYANLLNQISKSEIAKEVHEKLAAVEQEKQHAIALAETKTRSEFQQSLADKENEIIKLKAQANQKISELKNHNASEIAKLESLNAELQAQLASQISQSKTEQELAVTKAVTAIEKERDALASDLKTKDAEKKTLELSLKDKYESAIKFKDE